MPGHSLREPRVLGWDWGEDMRPGVISQGDCCGYSVLRTRKSGYESGVVWALGRESFQLGGKERPPGCDGL